MLPILDYVPYRQLSRLEGGLDMPHKAGENTVNWLDKRSIKIQLKVQILLGVKHPLILLWVHSNPWFPIRQACN